MGLSFTTKDIGKHLVIVEILKEDIIAILGISGGVEINDLTAAVTWANVPDANITESSVTQHEAALTHDNLIAGTIASHDTGATGAELDTLTDGSETTLHSHAGGADSEKVKIDTLATADFIGAAAGDGVLRTSSPLTYTDGGNFITLGVNDGAIDHDALLNFLADEHIDWTSTTENLSTTGTGALGNTTLSSSAATGGLTIDNTATTGDPEAKWALSSVVKFVAGIDDSNSDQFQIEAGTALTTSPDFLITSTGLVDIKSFKTKAITAEGHIKIGDIYLQWGIDTVAGNTTSLFNYDINFPTAALNLQVTWKETGEHAKADNYGGEIVSASQFRIANGMSSSEQFYWFAVGH